MFKRALACVTAVAMLAMGLPLAAQSEDFAERERALARELAEQQRELEAQQRELTAQQQEQEREFAREVEQQERELAAQQRERAAQQEQQQRSFARNFEGQQREYAAQQRAFAEQQREYQLTSARAQRELASELARAKSQLAVSAAEIARLSAQISEPAMVDVQNRVRYIGQGGVLGIGIDDTELGVRVESVSPNGPAAAAGVAVGDTIVAIDDFELGREANTRIDSPSAAFLGQLADVEPGEEVELRIVRNGNTRDVVVKPTENGPYVRLWGPQSLQGLQGLQGLQSLQGLRAAAGSQGRQGPQVTVLPNGRESVFMMFQRPWSDIELVPLTPALGEYFATDAGLLVVRAGRMGELGLRDGDVILDIGGREPQTPEHAMRILSSFEPEEPIPMSVMRQRRRETLRITVPEETVGWYTGNSGDIWVTGPPRPQRGTVD
jgi:type II secretory pathway component PulC